ncbi:MAG: aminotransferase class I/II-fold pyridoxal phosphate-dependent enzyme [Bacteroidetes bacterium]|nr:MAG: aminotransferase class I/II-fold pyridoxal phosphate-dependent enzyme [Bacteroidota bacterium]
MPEFNGSLSSKLPKVGTTIFSVMTAMANENQALNMAQGFPDFSCSPELISLVNHYMNKQLNQYAPMPGVPVLREKIAAKTEELYSAQYNPDTEITVTPGATMAIYAAISAVVKEGDEVIIIEPAYDSYLPAIELNGGHPIFAELKYPSYSVDWDEIRKLITFKTRMIIINTPHNPTGMAFSAADMQKLQKLTENSDIIILSDEVYEHILFDGLEHQSIARYPKLAERSFIISSFGKTYHNTGWKMGYCLAPAKLTTEFRKIFQYMMFSVNTPVQYALADFMDKKDAYLELSAFYQEKRDFFQKAIKGSKWKVLNCQGSYFQMLGYDKITHEDDMDFARRLVVENKIAAIPTSSFYRKKNDNHVLRFCFAKQNDTLEKAAEILHKL